MNQSLHRATQEARFWDDNVHQAKRRFFRRNWYSRINAALRDRMLDCLGNVRGLKVLFIGCGEDATTARKIAEQGAEAWCIDLSPSSIEKLSCYPFGDLRRRIRPFVADAEHTPFPNNSFDAATGKSIIHHLDISLLMDELARVCKPGAAISFAEPLGTNPLINLFRKATPNLRVPSEHPLRPRDIRLIESRCRSLRLEYREWLSMTSYPWSMLGLTRVGALLHRSLSAVDAALFAAVPPTRWLAWSVILAGELLSTDDHRSTSTPIGEPTEGKTRR